MEDSDSSQRRRLEVGHGDGQAALEACPAPWLLISPEGVVQRLDEAFARLVQAPREALQEQPFVRCFHIFGRFRWAELWARLAEGCVKAVPASLAYVAPGRVVLARAFLCPMAIAGQDRFSCLVMLDGASSRRAAVGDEGTAANLQANPCEPLKMSA